MKDIFLPQGWTINDSKKRTKKLPKLTILKKKPQTHKNSHNNRITSVLWERENLHVDSCVPCQSPEYRKDTAVWGEGPAQGLEGSWHLASQGKLRKVPSVTVNEKWQHYLQLLLGAWKKVKPVLDMCTKIPSRLRNKAT